MSTAPAAIEPKFHFKDEGKDVLGDVLKDPNRQAISGDTGTNFEPVTEAATPALEPTPAPATETSTAPPAPTPTISTSTAPPPAPEPTEAKLYAGKFKSVEDLEKGYAEIQKSFTTKAQEASAARKALEERERATPPSPEETEAQRLARINEMLTDPDKYFADQARKASERVIAETKSAQEVAAFMEGWRSANKDVSRYEQYIGVVMHQLTSADPNLDPMAALEQATTSVREELGRIRDEGKREALALQSGATTPVASKVIVPPPTEQPPQAPMSDTDAYAAHMAELNANAQRVRRQVR